MMAGTERFSRVIVLHRRCPGFSDHCSDEYVPRKILDRKQKIPFSHSVIDRTALRSADLTQLLQVVADTGQGNEKQKAGEPNTSLADRSRSPVAAACGASS